MVGSTRGGSEDLEQAPEVGPPDRGTSGSDGDDPPPYQLTDLPLVLRDEDMSSVRLGMVLAVLAVSPVVFATVHDIAWFTILSIVSVRILMGSGEKRSRRVSLTEDRLELSTGWWTSRIAWSDVSEVSAENDTVTVVRRSRGAASVALPDCIRTDRAAAARRVVALAVLVRERAAGAVAPLPSERLRGSAGPMVLFFPLWLAEWAQGLARLW
ncbi:MAG: hypothetical protein U0Q15_17890 [Kineosporiaceae bacterium]